MQYLDSLKKDKKEAPKQNAKAAKAAARARQQQQQQRQRAQAVQSVTADDDEVSDDDLIASTAGMEDPGATSPPSVFCSLSGRSHHLTRAVQAVAQRASQHWLPRIQRRQPPRKERQQIP